VTSKQISSVLVAQAHITTINHLTSIL